MRVLVGVACIAVIAAVGYYFMQEYRTMQAADADRDRIDGVRAELFRFAGANKGEDAKVRVFCRNLSAAKGKTARMEEDFRFVERNCRGLGYL
jgi:hypothetical protein